MNQRRIISIPAKIIAIAVFIAGSLAGAQESTWIITQPTELDPDTAKEVLRLYGGGSIEEGLDKARRNSESYINYQESSVIEPVFDAAGSLVGVLNVMFIGSAWVFTADNLMGTLEGKTEITPDKYQEHCEQTLNTHISCLNDSYLRREGMSQRTDDLSDCIIICLKNSANLYMKGQGLVGLGIIANNVCTINQYMGGVFHLPPSSNRLCKHASSGKEFWDCKEAVLKTNICGLPSPPSSD